MYVIWKKGPDIQKFYQCIQMNYDNDAYFEVPVDDDDMESKSPRIKKRIVLGMGRR